MTTQLLAQLVFVDIPNDMLGSAKETGEQVWKALRAWQKNNELNNLGLFFGDDDCFDDDEEEKMAAQKRRQLQQKQVLEKVLMAALKLKQVPREELDLNNNSLLNVDDDSHQLSIKHGKRPMYLVVNLDQNGSANVGMVKHQDALKVNKNCTRWVLAVMPKPRVRTQSLPTEEEQRRLRLERQMAGHLANQSNDFVISTVGFLTNQLFTISDKISYTFTDKISLYAY